MNKKIIKAKNISDLREALATETYFWANFGFTLQDNPEYYEPLKKFIELCSESRSKIETKEIKNEKT